MAGTEAPAASMHESGSKTRVSWPLAVALMALAIASSGCSIKKFAAGNIANSLATGPDVFGTDDEGWGRDATQSFTRQGLRRRSWGAHAVEVVEPHLP